MAARVIQVCDAVVAVVREAWGTPPPDAVERRYTVPVPESVTGRKVYVFPDRTAAEPGTRGEDLRTFVVAVVVAERYADPGTPSDDWADERVEFVQTVIEDALDFPDDGPGFLVADSVKLYTLSNEIGVYEVDDLTSRKLFWSESTIEFQGYWPR